MKITSNILRLILPVILLFLCQGCEEEEEKFDASEIWLYEFYDSTGYTNPGALRKFDELSKNQVPLIRLKEPECKILKDLIKKAKVKKLFPGKTGQNILFLIVIDGEGIKSKVIMSSTALRDFTNGKDYWIREKEQQIQMNKLMQTISFSNY